MITWCPFNYLHTDENFVVPVPMLVPVEDGELENPWAPDAALRNRCEVIAQITVEATRQAYDPEWRSS